MALHDPHPLELGPDEGLGGGGATPLATFGRYLLFKRLREDALGEVYRAGQLGDQAIERVVSLRLFNGAEIDGKRFWQACQRRVPLHTKLRGGPFGEVVDLGCHDGVAFVAHEFVFGRSLAELLTQAREQSYPVPLEHTLHLMDRIAIGLQNAYEKRLDEKRVIHGCLVPDFVHISGEGEVRVNAFEITGGLLEVAATAPARAAFAGYTSPEVNAGQPPKASDDIYSLGAIFGELLTGEPLPALNPSESSRWVEAATLAGEAEPLPENIRHLLRESLLPRDQRPQTAEQWHRALLEITATSGHTSTTFDVAFFMHTLFGRELELEAALVEAELQAEVPPPAPRAVEASASAPDEVVAPEAAEITADAADPEVLDPAPAVATPAVERQTSAPARPVGAAARAQSASAPSSSRRWIAIAAGTAAVLGLGAAYFLFGPSGAAEEAPTPIVVSAPPRPEVTAAAPAISEPQDVVGGIAAVEPPLSPEELEEQVRSLVAERAGDLEANLKAEYDQRLVELRQQLEEARKAAAAARAAQLETETETVAAEQPSPQPTPVPAAKTPTPTPAKPAPAVVAAQPRAEPEARPAAEAAAVAPPVTPEAPRVEAPAPERRTEPAPSTQPAPIEKPAPVAAEPEPVEPGSIVANGPGVTPPSLVRQPRAVYPAAAARLKRQATVRVRILVDERGRASEIEQVGKKVGLGFDAAALKAARATSWTPPMKDGVPVKMWVELSIDFQP